MREGRRLATILGTVWALAVGGIAPAHAAFIASICNDVNCAGGGDVTIVDQSVSPQGDFDPAVGVIIANTVVGGLTTAVNVSQTKPAIGSALKPQLDLGFVATGVGEVWLYASDTDYTGVVPLRLQIGGTSTSAPINVEAFAGGGSDNANHTPGVGFIGGTGPFSGSPFTAETITGIVGSTVIPYSLTLGVHVTQNGGTSTGNANLDTQVPEPAAALLLATGLFGLGALVRRRRRHG